MRSSSITLVITGSIAAVKSFDVVRALKSQGSQVDVILTAAARQWVTREAMAPYADSVTMADAAHAIASQSILIAPASADFIYQLAHNASSLAQHINRAGVPIFIAPAMNVMMWQHPATQRNVRALLRRGMIFLGPVQGSMACGDTGFGRFMEPGPIGGAVGAMMMGDGHAAFLQASQAIIDSPQLPHITLHAAQKKNKHILLLIQGGQDAAAIVYPLIARLRSDGHSVTCALGEDAQAVLPLEGLASASGSHAYTHHFQEDDQGMEHIRLPERADMMLVVPATREGARDMVQGAARDLAGCMYLASKKPVLLAPSGDRPPTNADLGQLKADGVYVLESAPQGDAIADAFDALMRSIDLTGKNILVIGGRPKEMLDGVRHFANHARPENDAAHTAQTLTRRGAEVTLVQAQDTMSTAKLLAACEAQKGPFDTVLQLACIPAVKPAKPSTQKLKIKTDTGAKVALDVVGNTDIQTWLSRVFAHSACAGYDNQQQWFGSREFYVADGSETLPPMTVTPFAATQGALSDRHIIVTSGPTIEKISSSGDVISNMSSGRQGYAIAAALAQLGARVTLVSGPSKAPAPLHPGIRTVYVVSAKEMYDACMTALPADSFIGVAAVADFGMGNPLPLAFDEGAARTLNLLQNPDILEAMGTHATLRPALVIGFAAETDRVQEYARAKLEKKNADIICANAMADVSADGNKITYVTREGIEALPQMSKAQVAEHLATKIAALL